MLSNTIRQVETSKIVGVLAPVELAIMLATGALWTEERVKGLRGSK